MNITIEPTLSRLLHKLLGVAVLFLAQSVSSAEMCPAINCDCPSLPNESWQLVCTSHEAKIKEDCARNNNKPTEFCSLHGPSAKPLPMVVKFGHVNLLPQEEIKKHHKQVETLAWTIHADLEAFTGLANDGRYGEAQGTLNLIDKHLDELFTKQRQVTISFEVNDSIRGSSNAWRDYSKASLKHAEDIYQAGLDLQKKMDAAEDSKSKKAFRILSTKTLRIASKAYEMAAYAFAGARQENVAARAWRDASDISKAIMEQKIASGASQAHIDYYRKQTAMRLMRASYHWMLDGQEDDAKTSLQASRDFVGNKALIDELLFDGNEPTEPATEEAIADYKAF